MTIYKMPECNTLCPKCGLKWTRLRTTVCLDCYDKVLGIGVKKAAPTFRQQLIDAGVPEKEVDDMASASKIVGRPLWQHNKLDQSFKTIYLHGGTGCGKTTTGISAMQDRIEKGLPLGEYWKEVKIAETFVSTYSKDEFKRFPNELAFVKFLVGLPFLMIDDLSVERMSPIRLEKLLEVIGDRIGAYKPTLITSNLSPLQLHEAVSNQQVQRLVSRLMEKSSVLVLGLGGVEHRLGG